MQTFDPEVIEFTKQLQSWHASRVANLQVIVDHPEADIKLADIEIKAGSDIAKGMRVGLQIALSQLGELPFSVTPCTDEEEDE
ncbi:hypothetical protein [Paludibacterium denitrificans]|uniref:Uncharacterized protein n=1 Tax=Paludibacterium denitrificans TaxID=2675226 RepID=A0A844GH27_9NEIS|nr:hypothetical protein [Paludibacterium denitrificans]MTD33974.1 hypothetical protein [Paludibacterium denitrificans]